MEKKITLSLRRCLLLAGTMVFVSSCQDYEPFSDETLHDKAYTHEFVKQFGEIDPDQDWDLFGQLAQHIGPVTRAAMDDTPSVTQLSDTVRISPAQHANYTKILPELDIPNNTYANSNLGQVTQDFLTTARKITLVPVHWHTSATDAIGIYWYVDEDGPGVKTIMGKDDKLYYIKEYTILENHKTRLALEVVYRDGHKDQRPLDGVLAVEQQFLSQAQMDRDGIVDQYLVSQPYEITIPNSITEYGFWIKNLGSGLDERFSEWKLNSKPSGPIEDNGDHMSYTATFNLSSLKDEAGNPLYPNDKSQYLCFEDWINWGDADLNDLVFIAKGLDDSNIKDNNTIYEKALLVCEDLKSFDFDFNDIILGLTFKEEDKREYKWVPESGGIAAHWELKSTEATNQTLFVKPLAAGGAYETTVQIGTYPISAVGGEIHYLMGEGTPREGTGSKTHQIINAGAKYANLSDSIPVILNTYQWNVGTGQGKYATHLSQLFAEGYISLACYDGNAQKILTSSTINLDKNTPTAPQMMLLPDYFEWPREQIHISTAYTAFSDWVSDITKTSWILDSQVADNITDRGDLKPDVPVEEENPNLIETIEVPIHRQRFIFDDPDEPWVFDNAYFVNLSGVDALVLNNANAKADVIVHYAKKYDTYLDDADGNLLVEDNFGDGLAHTTTYTLSANKFNMAVTSGGMWIIPQDDENDFAVSKVEIKLYGATDPNKRHNLDVNPMSILLDEIGQTVQLNVTSTTNANITYSSANTDIATIGADGIVRATGEGSCEITVRASGGTYQPNFATVKVVVNKTPTLSLAMSDPFAAASFEGPEYTINGQSTTTYDNVYHITASTKHNLNTWTNGAKLSIHYRVVNGDGSPQIFRIKNPAGNVIAGNLDNLLIWEGDLDFTISGSDLQSCLKNGQFEFTIEYRTPPSAVTSASLTKIATE